MDWQAVAKLMATALSAIDGVSSALSSAGSDAKRLKDANHALLVIQAILETVKSGAVEDIDPEQANLELQQLLSSLGDNDSAADAALADKFDTSA